MSSGIISVSTTQPTLEGSPESQDLDMHDLGGVLSWEAPESMLRVMSDLVMLVAVLLGKIWTFYGCLWIAVGFFSCSLEAFLNVLFQRLKLA